MCLIGLDPFFLTQWLNRFTNESCCRLFFFLTCADCELIALLEDDTGMELLVCNKIISLDLPVKDVYKKIWCALPNVSLSHVTETTSVKFTFMKIHWVILCTHE